MKKFLALYMGAPVAGEPVAATRSQETIAAGMAAWGAWMEQNAAAIVDTGGPLGHTKKASPDGLSDIRNRVAGYVVLNAESHDAAARLFLNHPHFAIFPGDSVEIMEVLPIPGT